jgi:hypothetical protein
MTTIPDEITDEVLALAWKAWKDAEDALRAQHAAEDEARQPSPGAPAFRDGMDYADAGLRAAIGTAIGAIHPRTQPLADLREALIGALRDDAPADGRLIAEHAADAVLPVVERHVADQVQRWQVIAGSTIESRRTALDEAARNCDDARRDAAAKALMQAAAEMDQAPTVLGGPVVRSAVVKWLSDRAERAAESDTSPVEVPRRMVTVEALRAAARRIEDGPGHVIGTREHMLHIAGAGEWLRQLADATEEGHEQGLKIGGDR